MRYKMYALVLASVLAIASTGCQAIKTSSCGPGSNVGSAQSCGCQNCRNGATLGGGAVGYQSGQSGVFNSGGNSGANAQGFAGNGAGPFGAGGNGGALGAGGMGMGGAAGKARGLFGKLINRAAAHDCQTPYTQPFADSGMPGGPMTPTYGYPYYTTRAPRDFFTCNPPSIGP